MSNRIVHFEIHAADPERAAVFYRDVLGWEISKWEGADVGMEYWMVMTAPKDSAEPGINGGIVRRGGQTPAEQQGCNAFVCTAVVEDIDAAAAKILAAGGKEALPKFALKGMAWQAYYLDTEGNTFGIHQPDEKAGL